MGEQTRTLGSIASVVRSKNAGPFWLTLDVFFRDDDDFEHVRRSNVLNAQNVGRLYQVDPALVKVFELPELRVVKISIPRQAVAGSFEDSDLHGGQQHVPLALLPVRVDA
jgi:hypothetical protein